MLKAYVIGTCDTKYAELQFVVDRLQAAGVPTQLVDVGSFPHSHPVDISNQDVAGFHPHNRSFLKQPTDRGATILAMAEALTQFLLQQSDLGGVIGLGGGGGTSLISHAMRALPIGLPKVMVSTLASGNVAPFVGASDIFMLYSVTDVAGINAISNQILSNAAHALAGMLQQSAPSFSVSKPALGMSMFGVTTPCVTQLREALQDEYECLVFHATGTGGRSMEKLIDSGYLRHVIDITTTEICDLRRHSGCPPSA
ncbi:MAG: Tm-1-like ATP-binding domain-containing protein, partial [Bacteroidota bacterium]